MDIAFVVLHYKTYKQTVSCVESILSSQGSDGFRIVIVDNGSGDGSGDELLTKYGSGSPGITVILSPDNLGFACGMNLGISYLHSEGWKGFIALLNNDTVLSQPGWTEIVNRKYNQYHFAVLGPDIVNRDGSHSNPQRDFPIDIKHINKTIFRLRILPIIHSKLLAPLRSLKQRLSHVTETVSIPRLSVSEDTVGCSLQGGCLILSPAYFE